MDLITTPKIVLPHTSTIIPFTPAIIGPIIIDPSELSRASSPKQLALLLRSDIDPERLRSERYRKGTTTNAYKVEELRNIAKRIGIKGGQNKKELVESIRLALGYN
jgi:hypothetical protein